MSFHNQKQPTITTISSQPADSAPAQGKSARSFRAPEVEAEAAPIDLGIEELSDATLIGEGGFASVYAATDRRLARRVAVKVMRHNLSASAQRKFARECAIMGRLSGHPNVATVYSAGYTDDGRPYIVMRLLTGGSLGHQLARSGPMRWADAVQCMLPVASALDAAHRAGILHRDVKPANILLEGGEPYLTDFGIAQLRRVQTDTTSEVVASWHHSPPETLDDERDERSDIYSAASTMYTLIVGHGPFSDPDNRSFLSLMRRVTSEPPPELPPELGPPELSRFFARALAKNPDERPQSAGELVGELRQLAALSWSAPGSTRRRQGQGRPRRSTMWLVGAALAIGGGLTGIIAVARSDGDRRPEPAAQRSTTIAVAEEPADTATDDAAEAPGTLENPYPVGQQVSLYYLDPDTGTDREWRVEVVEPTTDRTEDYAGNPTSAGERLASVSVTLTYHEGVEPGPSAHFRFVMTGPTGETYVSTDACGPADGRLDLGAGAAVAETIAGRLCWWVPAAELSALTLAVEAEPADGVAYFAVG